MTTAKAAFGQQKRAVPWWIPLIEGIALIIIGILLFSNPAATIVVLAQVLAIYWLISGIMEIVSLFLDRTAWGLKLLGGIIGIWAGLFIINIIFGLILLGNTLIAAATLPWVLGAFALIGGIATVVMAFRLRTT